MTAKYRKFLRSILDNPLCTGKLWIEQYHKQDDTLWFVRSVYCNVIGARAFSKQEAQSICNNLNRLQGF